MQPQQLSIDQFSYELPQEKIAKFPLAQRDSSKLLVYAHQNITQSTYADLASHLPEQSMLVFNNTKVVEARLLFKKDTGTVIEIFCLEPADEYPDITTAMAQSGRVLWKCLVGGAKKWKTGSLEKEIGLQQLPLEARKVEKYNDYFLIEFVWGDATLSFAEVLHLAGQIPLPPYLNRSVEDKDKETYQTVYAKYDGSVAAPTAGLHFTKPLLRQLQQKHIREAFVTLHVGAGTFKPVKSATMATHEMHAEFMEVPLPFIDTLLDNLQQKIVAVGTTSLRTIESLYWMGVKIITAANEIEVQQWDPYNLPQNIAPQEALQALKTYLVAKGQNQLFARTQVIIAPGYRLKIADGIITNFHQPKSTLLLLVSAVVGDAWRDIYDYALSHDFRFLSYGDGSLLWKSE